MKKGTVLRMMFLLLSAGFWQVGVIAAMDDCVNSDCERSSGLTIDLSYPAWIEEYPAIDQTIRVYLNTTMRDYMEAMVGSDYDYVAIERTIGLDVTYEEVAYDEEIITLVYRETADYGGLYPLDALRTFTLYIVEDRRLEITDIFRDDADVTDILRPYIETQLTSEDIACCFDDDELDHVTTYNTFTLEPDSLTLLYPLGRYGPIHAGAMPVVVSLDDIAADLNPAIFGD